MFSPARCSPGASVPSGKRHFTRSCAVSVRNMPPVSTADPVAFTISMIALSAKMAKAAGARAVILSSSDDKLTRAKDLGADGGINYRAEPDWEKKVLELTGGHGADRVVEVGGGTLAKSIAALAVGGRIHMIGFMSGRDASFAAPLMVGKAASLEGIMVGSRAMFEGLNAAFAANGLKPVIDRVFGFGDAREAFLYQRSADLFGKVVIAI